MKRAAGVAAGAFDCGCADVLFLGRERPAAEHKAFPFGEGGRAQRGRMRSFSHPPAWPGGSGRCDAAARPCRFRCGRTSSPARKLSFSFPVLKDCCAAPGLPPGPAQGLTPPLHPRKGFHPLTHFRWRDYVELREGAVSIAGCGAACSETLASFRSFFLFFSVAPGLPPGPAQGLTPPLHPRKGHRPLTRFRWRTPGKSSFQTLNMVRISFSRPLRPA